MKNLFYLLFISLTILSCSKNDDSLKNPILGPILGEWKLIKITSDGTYNPSIIDYSNKNIIYNFTSDHYNHYYSLIITGEENSGYSNGEYEYNFKNDYLGPGPWGEDEQKVPIVTISGSKYGYNLTDGLMTLRQSYIKGGSDFIFEKVK